jgi:hypothetical protein
MTTDIKHSLIHSTEDTSDNMDTTINERPNHLLSRCLASPHVATKNLYVR